MTEDRHEKHEQKPPLLTNRARGLRRDATKAERLLWSRLKDHKILALHFRRQHPVPPYIVDFACRRVKLAIELDGWSHDDREADDRRQAFLEECGYVVIRFGNLDVLDRLDDVVEIIYRACERLLETDPHPALPLGGGGALRRV